MSIRRFEMAGKSSTTREYRGVQALRGLAACMVVAFHATEVWTARVGSGWGAWANGASGVDIFFVISGFVMAVSSKGKRAGPHPARDFMERRLVRIMPLYWLTTGVQLLKLWAATVYPSLANPGAHVALSFRYIAASLLFVPYRNTVGFVLPVLSVGWTLSYEMFFYMVFATALALRISEVRLLAPVMILLALLGIVHGSFGPAIGVLASPLLLEFLAGVLIGRLSEVAWRLQPALAAAIAILSVMAILMLPIQCLFGIGWLTRGTFAVLLVLSVMMLETKIAQRTPRWVLAIGDASYSLYLSHLLLFSLLYKPIARFGLLMPGAIRLWGEMATVVLLLVPSVMVSLALYRWVEAPLNNRLRRRLKVPNATMQEIAPEAG